MKILRLKLLNLNSLQGANAVDFTLPPLANSGLFAITGPTGAGKSTLLDAITLALYGRAARYGTAPNPEAMMSRHTGECSAEVEFSCATGQFRSVWMLQRAHKKPDGKLQAPKRRVVALPAETIIAESIKDADAKILELTGLDYDRFLRSVLLAQGDFAAFLKAGPKERAELLQQVTGTGIYQDISRAAFRRADAAEKIHAALLHDRQAILVLTPEVRAQQEKAVIDQQQRAENLAGRLRELAQRLTEAGRWLQLDKSVSAQAVEKARYAEDFNRASAALETLLQHEKATPAIADLTSLDRLDDEHASDTAKREQLAQRLPELSRLLAVATAAATTARLAMISTQQHQADQDKIWEEVTALDRDVVHAQRDLRQITEQHRDLLAKEKTLTASLTKETDLLEINRRDRHNAEIWLTANSRDATLVGQQGEIQATAERWFAQERALAQTEKSYAAQLDTVGKLRKSHAALIVQSLPLQNLLERHRVALAEAQSARALAEPRQSLLELERLRDESQATRLLLERLEQEAGVIARLSTKLADLQKVAAANSTDQGILQQNRRQLQSQLDQASTLLSAHRTALVFAEKVQSLEAHRAALKPLAPCPLCGSPDHPFSTHDNLPAAELVAARQRVTDAAEAENTSRKRLTTNERESAVLLADHDRLKKEIARHGDEHAPLLAVWNLAAAPHGFSGRVFETSDLETATNTARAAESKLAARVTAVRAADQAVEKATSAHREAERTIETCQHQLKEAAVRMEEAEKLLPTLNTSKVTQTQDARAEQKTFTDLILPYVDSASPAPNLANTPIFIESLKNRSNEFTRREKKAAQIAGDLTSKQAQCADLTTQKDEATAAAATASALATKANLEFDRIKRQRLDKFGQRTVAEARHEANIILQKAEGHATTTKDACEAHRQQEAAALHEKKRLETALGGCGNDRAIILGRLEAATVVGGFTDLTALRAALLPSEVAASSARIRDDLKERDIALTTKVAETRRERDALPDSAQLDAAHFGPLQGSQSGLETERTSALQTVGQITGILNSDTEQRARQQGFAQQLEGAHRDYVRWHRLSKLIGSADGLLFARFAQGLTLERLTALANRHLVDLNPRYSICGAADGEAGDLDLEIIDHYQADVARPMRSLSGGETFLVSLALALGLSDLASGHNSIETLFIDEGFGSLSPETLEMAMAALENLQASGKTIGVISHVPAMQERITTQINVSKETNGCSRVRMAS